MVSLEVSLMAFRPVLWPDSLDGVSTIPTRGDIDLNDMCHAAVYYWVRGLFRYGFTSDQKSGKSFLSNSTSSS